MGTMVTKSRGCTVPVQLTSKAEPVSVLSGAVTVTSGAVTSMDWLANVRLPSLRT